MLRINDAQFKSEPITMRKYLFFALFICGMATSGAQVNISVSPAISERQGSPFSNDISAHANVTNHSDFQVELLWSRRIVSAPQEWLSWVCDVNSCYLHFVDQAPQSQPIILEPGANSNLDYHVNPNFAEGAGEYVVYLFEKANPETILDSVRYIISTATTSVSDPLVNSLKIYPNPAGTYFELTSTGVADKLVIYSVAGNQLREFDARLSARFDISDIQQGVYLVRLFQNSHVVKTLRLIRQ